MKFKVGDKVKTIASTSQYSKGWTGKIVKEDGSRSCRVEYDNGRASWAYYDDIALATQSLPINIVFSNKYEHQAVQQFLFDNGCKWVASNKEVRNYGVNTITVDENKEMISNADGMTCYPDYPSYTISDLDTIKEILNYKNPISTIELNSEHTAEINKDTKTVKVGCQTFTFDKVKELAKIINEN